MCVNKVKWNSRSNKMILSDKTHAIIAFPGLEFMNLATKIETYENPYFKTSVNQSHGFDNGSSNFGTKFMMG